MAVQLSEEQKKSIKNLDQNFDKKVEEYRAKKEKELTEGKRAELENELKNASEYYQGCQNGEIDDTLTNIRFWGAKIEVLKKILEK